MYCHNNPVPFRSLCCNVDGTGRNKKFPSKLKIKAPTNKQNLSFKMLWAKDYNVIKISINNRWETL